MKAILVCVDYSDFLAITLPYNRHHFEEVMVVTAPNDQKTLQIAVANEASVFVTDAFYNDGADFNKWLALEKGLDRLGRDGLICLMDADVLWPKHIDKKFAYQKGCLYTPKRRMFEDLKQPIPKEPYWKQYPLHPQQREFAGYTQIFHADDLVLGPAPWHQTNWKHAGGADSFFQQKWAEENKIRPPFEVLHLGEAGVNWCGRTTPFLDGSIPPNQEEKRQQLQRYFRGRVNKTADKRFLHEQLQDQGE